MRKPREHIKDLSDIIKRIDKVDDEIEQVKRVRVRLEEEKQRLEVRLREAETRADIQVEDKLDRDRS